MRKCCLLAVLQDDLFCTWVKLIVSERDRLVPASCAKEKTVHYDTNKFNPLSTSLNKVSQKVIISNSDKNRRFLIIWKCSVPCFVVLQDIHLSREKRVLAAIRVVWRHQSAWSLSKQYRQDSISHLCGASQIPAVNGVLWQSNLPQRSCILLSCCGCSRELS